MIAFDQEFIASDLERTPLLARLWPERGRTDGVVRIEWDGGFNYSQLWITRIRTGWDDGIPEEPRDDQIAAAMRELASEVEWTLHHGKRWMNEKTTNPNKAWCVGGIGTDGITAENAQLLVEVGPRVEAWLDGYVIRFAWTLAPSRP